MYVEGFILVGGASSRMGRDKAGLTISGRLFVERIGEALSAVAGRVSTVGARAQQTFPAYGNVPDIFESWGALGGLHAALEGCRADWALVVACDLPFVTNELLKRLVTFGEGFEAVVPVQPDGRLQPLCALYRREPCRERARQLIEQNERRPRALIERVLTRRVSWGEISDLEGASLFFMNVNTPEDYRRARSSFGEVTD